jgi:rare lipoprotein A
MLTKDRVQSCASTLALVVLLSFSGLGHLAAQTHRPPAGHFEDAFGGRHRVEPTFTRPDVTRRLPALPAQPGESAPAISPENSQAQSGSEDPKKKGVLSTLKKVLIPSAKAKASPAPAPPEVRPPAPEPQATVAVPASRNRPVATRRLPHQARVGVRRLAQPMVRSRTSQNAKVARAVQPAARGLRVAWPTVSRLGQLGSGRAVWYQHPGRTASGEKYNPNGLTAAHRTLPLGTRVRVVNKKNGRSVVVRINDRVNVRTQATAHYLIDLSRGSARALGIEDVGSVALYKAK